MNPDIPTFPDNPAQRSACLIVLDLSGSKRPASAHRMQRVADSLDQGFWHLREDLASDPMCRERVELSVVDGGGAGHDAQVLLDWVDPAGFMPPHPNEGGISRLPQAMRLALDHLERHKQALRREALSYTRPWIMVLSSGEIDAGAKLWASIAQDCRQAERDKRCVIFPVALDDAAPAPLQTMTASRVAALSVDRFDAFFHWLAAALGSTSRSTPGMAVQLPPVQPWARF
jgi:uncharacterized protein YegL